MSLEKELNLERPMQDAKHEAVLNVVRTASLLSLKGSDLFRQFGLTEAQFNVLFSLKYKEKVWTQSDLGKRLVVTRASVTSVLDKLESKGLVARHGVEGNRRIYHIDLTPAGRALIDEVEPLYRRDVYEVMADLDEAACRMLTKNLERIRERCLR
jgi:MarR family 2-MHQ and catechol resistance regulon transcriptional repressor